MNAAGRDTIGLSAWESSGMGWGMPRAEIIRWPDRRTRVSDLRPEPGHAQDLAIADQRRMTSHFAADA